MSQTVTSKANCNALYPFSSNLKWGYIDCHGKVIVEPKFISAYSFTEGFGLVYAEEADRKYATGKLINLKGEIITANGIEVVSDFSEGLAGVYKNSFWGYVDKSGKVVLEIKHQLRNDEMPTPIQKFSEGLASIYTDNGGGFINKKGQIVIEPRFDYVWNFNDGMALVTIDGKFGLIDKTGRYIFNLQKQTITQPSEGFAIVGSTGDWKCLNNQGQTVFQVDYDYLGSFHHGLAQIKVGNKWGFVNKSGEIVITPIYEYVDDFSEGLAAVLINNKYGFINKKGEFQIQPKFDYIYAPFVNSLAYVKIGLLDAYINKNGDFVWLVSNKEDTQPKIGHGRRASTIGKADQPELSTVIPTAQTAQTSFLSTKDAAVRAAR